MLLGLASQTALLRSRLRRLQVFLHTALVATCSRQPLQAFCPLQVCFALLPHCLEKLRRELVRRLRSADSHSSRHQTGGTRDEVFVSYSFGVVGFAFGYQLVAICHFEAPKIR